MRRRTFLGVIGGAAAAWPGVAKGQQSGGIPQIGLLMTLPESDPEAQARVSAFQRGLEELDWSEGRNIRTVVRWSPGDAKSVQALAKELIGLKPNLVVATTSLALTALRAEDGSLPIVFVNLTDPVGTGLVPSLARPGGNTTGLTNFEYTMGGKWLGTLKEIAPNLGKVAAICNPDSPVWPVYLRSIEAAAASLNLSVIPTGVRNIAEIERAIDGVAREQNVGLIVLPEPVTTTNRSLIIALAARHRLPTIYPFRYFAIDGGLMSYGVNVLSLYRGAARYVDRILKGQKPGDLPIQLPTKFEFVINIKTAKALGLTVSDKLLVAADEVIE